MFSCGGSATPIDWGELYTSLQQGVVDGAENNPPSFETSLHYEICKYYSLDKHTMPPAVLIFTPIFLPIVTRFGMNLVHFGIIMIMNLCIGLCTPPVGTCLFLGCGIAQTTVTKVMRHIMPFFVAMIIALLICTYVPWFSMYLPTRFGFLSGKF